MILVTEQNTIRQHGFGEAERFLIEASAKTFSIMSSVIYKDPILAVVRELACNAYDAHIVAGTTMTPFVIKCPTIIDPEFSIRDFGTGLSLTDLKTLYRTYGKSSKEQTNDLTGALGIGSKSPFAYTKSFSVTSYFNGTRHVLLAFLDEEQIPALTHLESAETDQPNGLEVSFLVKGNDCSKFSRAIQQFFRTWTKTTPSVKQCELLHPYEASKTTFGEDWALIDSSDAPAQPIVVMGNVPYPINSTTLYNSDQFQALTKSHQTAIQTLVARKWILTVPIGAVDFAASREELQYTKRTCVKLIEKITEIVDHISTRTLEPLVSTITGKWEAALFYKQQQAAFGTIVEYKTADESTTTLACGLTFGELKQVTNSRDGFVVENASALLANCFIKANEGKSIHALNISEPFAIPIRDEFNLLINDVEKGAITRIRHNYTVRFTRYSSRTIVIIEAKTPTAAVTQGMTFAKHCGIPESNIKLISSLKTPPRAKAKKSAPRGSKYQGIKLDMSIVTDQYLSRATHLTGHSWEGKSGHLFNIPEDGVIVPVTLRNYKPVNPQHNCVFSNDVELLQLVSKYSIVPLDKIYGVTTAKYASITTRKKLYDVVIKWAHDNFKSIVDYHVSTTKIEGAINMHNALLVLALAHNGIPQEVLDKDPLLGKISKALYAGNAQGLFTNQPNTPGFIRAILEVLDIDRLSQDKVSYNLLTTVNSQLDAIRKQTQTAAKDIDEWLTKNPVISAFVIGASETIVSSYKKTNRVAYGDFSLDNPRCKQAVDMLTLLITSTSKKD